MLGLMAPEALRKNLLKPRFWCSWFEALPRSHAELEDSWAKLDGKLGPPPEHVEV